jgi:hypothetical protein
MRLIPAQKNIGIALLMVLLTAPLLFDERLFVR